MDTPDASRAQQDLQQARAVQASAMVVALRQRSRWVVAGVAVFALSLLGWLAGPGPVNIAIVVLGALCVLASLVVRNPRWAGLVGIRARLAGSQARAVRWFVVVTVLGVLALVYLINAVGVLVFREPYPFGGLVVGCLLAFGGPAFARGGSEAREARSELVHIDPLLANPTRLKVVAVLASCDWAEFSFVCDPAGLPSRRYRSRSPNSNRTPTWKFGKATWASTANDAAADSDGPTSDRTTPLRTQHISRAGCDVGGGGPGHGSGRSG